eukprot:3712240-Prymnesium_polylepis.1
MGRLSLTGRPSARDKRTSLREAPAVQGTIVLEGWLSKKGGGGADGSMRNWAKVRALPNYARTHPP